MARGPPATKWLADYTGRFSWWKRPYFILMETGTYFGYRFAFLTIIILPKSPKWRLTGCLTYCRTNHLALLLWSGTHFTENKVYQWIQTLSKSIHWFLSHFSASRSSWLDRIEGRPFKEALVAAEDDDTWASEVLSFSTCYILWSVISKYFQNSRTKGWRHVSSGHYSNYYPSEPLEKFFLPNTQIWVLLIYRIVCSRGILPRDGIIKLFY